MILNRETPDLRPGWRKLCVAFSPLSVIGFADTLAAVGFVLVSRSDAFAWRMLLQVSMTGALAAQTLSMIAR